jgi:hypothetical protein
VRVAAVVIVAGPLLVLAAFVGGWVALCLVGIAVAFTLAVLIEP